MSNYAITQSCLQRKKQWCSRYFAKSSS